ncbi:MAG: hypothetical protein A2499_04020 [Stygiobacter sp. RIFOXYC12_FULL_38_8]|nr:MAG: hypothetical protein A2279_06360 [Stygiobacter sp. RIFOXYA12_FULL_38_9]OGV06887.1 MAG: hypothetical protein A2299_03180 [Stygiobacter sp. RIFOXYB2_FULL_37_11]OGV11581.1 MAG: hypothetical protein A2237_04905 [Stygiobacter sp. RIFOXYA2_FULL_38_8]OGV13346.1 MAG: hypothetical protein A2440_13560 [Stygiobacter sp. RIFOXYC2_FULL_38_25]OGV30296.1 MAG: hypothetical protein A2499_04020 [Stygiobacter sp. RIFOXYC12_FULL_38_8]OGV83392.1 MAG: hypothetical protein A2X65_17115 [Stygiobacter sp. GWF2_
MFSTSGFSKALLLSVVFLNIILFQTTISAIPAFARKYKTSCTTCHVAFSKRNLFGEAFRRNGYVMPLNDAHLVKEKPIALGSEAWKDLWPDAIWPGSIPESVPIAAVTNMRVSYDLQKANKGNRVEFAMPFLLNIVFGGAFGEDVSFFGEWAAYLLGENARGLQRFFVQFNNVVGEKSLLNIRVGRFEPGITDGYTSTQRLTMGYPLAIDYDATNTWKPRDPQSGIEVNGILNHHLYYAGGIVNGESKTIADPSDRKDVYLRLAYQLGDDGLDGRDTSYQSQDIKDWYNSISVGAFTYLGSRDKIQLTNGNTYNNNFSRYGFDVQMQISNLDMYGGIILGKDDNPDNDLKSLESNALFAEADYSFYPWLIGVLRVERAYSWKSNNDKDKYVNIIPHVTILYRANIRFSIEGVIKIFQDKNFNNTVIRANNENPFQLVMINALFAF